jgi:hypothetical protein
MDQAGKQDHYLHLYMIFPDQIFHGTTSYIPLLQIVLHAESL